MPNPVIDPWTQVKDVDGNWVTDPFLKVDWQTRPDDLIDPDAPTSTIDPALDQLTSLKPEVVASQPAAVELPPVEPPPEPEGPETMELSDGTLLTLEKEKGQWKGTATSPSGGSPQVFWGKTLKELIFNTLQAQANATKKIREQNAKLKFGQATAPPAQQPAATPTTRPLTADEKFEIKTLWESDPAAAIDLLMLKTRGVTMDQILAEAQEGRQASIELRADAVNREFRSRNPDFYPDAEFKNFEMMLKWLAKFKLGKSIKGNDVDPVFRELVATGNYTVENLEEAFEDLSSDGLLLAAPRPPRAPRAAEPTPPAAEPTSPVTPAPARTSERIVRVETRPRAALGIPSNSITPAAPPETPTAPSVDDLENMSDKEHDALWAAVMRQRALSRRSN